MNNLTNKQNGLGIARIFKATQCSYKGFKAAWQHESAFRQELMLGIVMMPFSFALAANPLHWVWLTCSVLFVLFAEVLNSAIEALADSITLEHHVLVGRAKDLGSSAVFISLLCLVLVWGEAISRIWL